MRILVADRLPSHFAASMRAAGHECVVDPALTDTDLPAAVGDVHVLVVEEERLGHSTELLVELAGDHQAGARDETDVWRRRGGDRPNRRRTGARQARPCCVGL